MEKIKLVWAVMPHNMEYSVQYCDTKEQAEEMKMQFYKGAADVAQIEQLQRVIDRKNKNTARRGYRY